MIWTDESILALQEGAEDILVHLFHMTYVPNRTERTLTDVVAVSSRPNSRAVKL